MSFDKHIVYGLKDPVTGLIRYVGKSCSGMKRPKQHASKARLSKETNLHKKNWILSLQEKGLSFVVEILEVCTSETLSTAEAAWIHTLRSKGEPLLNRTDGGDGISGFSHSEETKRKVSASKRGIPLADDHKRALAIAHGAMPFTDDPGQCFHSVQEASRVLGIAASDISRVLNRKRRTAGGRRFTFVVDSGIVDL
jgi:hypothetical protein